VENTKTDQIEQILLDTHTGTRQGFNVEVAIDLWQHKFQQQPVR
jgi:hypothetical protein